MKILAIGDVTSDPGLSILSKQLRSKARDVGADFIVVNGENASGVGITPQLAEQIYDAGADVITLGNHTFAKQNICDYLEDNKRILRPANYASQTAGRGFGIYEVGNKRLLVMSLIGRLSMPFAASDNPFFAADKILKDQAGSFDFCVCELHAEATSEKGAMGFYLDGRVGAVYGTHTHVQTADSRINPKGTGFITDIGMTGPIFSVLGIRPDQSIAFFRGDIPGRYQAAEGPCSLQGVCITLNDSTGLCQEIEPFSLT